MLRILPVLALVLLGCPEKTPEVVAPAVTGFRAPTLKCTLEIPAGWTLGPSPMPDHILEVLATAPKMRGRMVLREAVESSVSAAAEAAKKRTVASWGSQPDFTLLREDPMGEGRLIAYQWRPQPSAPVERHLVAALPFESKVVLAFVDDDGATEEARLLASISTLACAPK